MRTFAGRTGERHLKQVGLLLRGSASDLVNGGDADLAGIQRLPHFRDGPARSQVLGDGRFAEAQMGGQAKESLAKSVTASQEGIKILDDAIKAKQGTAAAK